MRVPRYFHYVKLLLFVLVGIILYGSADDILGIDVVILVEVSLGNRGDVNANAEVTSGAGSELLACGGLGSGDGLDPGSNPCLLH